MKWLKVPILMLILFLANVFGAEYIVRVDSMVLGRVRTSFGKNGWVSVSELEYGEKYIVETRTVYAASGVLAHYEAIFRTRGEVVAKIVGTRRQGTTNVTLYAYNDSSRPAVKTFAFDNPEIFIVDNNFVIPHFEMLLKNPRPVYQILIPQALFDPSKTEKASGTATLKRDNQGRFIFSYEGVEIRITVDKDGIVRMEYSNGIVVERVKK
ncbi:hypothetical protein [Fervidobacterium thailandense]|nr:hypothetical protein [Fervidobacterium thailandense]